MIREYSDAIDRLIAQERATLAGLTGGHPPDLEQLDATRAALFSDLQALGPAPDAPRVRSRLELLLKLNTASIEAFSLLKSRCGHRLGVLGKGQRRLRGYQNAAQGVRRGGNFGAA